MKQPCCCFWLCRPGLVVLSATSGGVCIISAVKVVGPTYGVARASFTLIFSLTTGIIKKEKAQ